MATVKGGAASRALFKHMDFAGSGRIQYEELRLAVRDTLRLDKRELPEPKLQGLWKVLDEEGSGFIGAGERRPLKPTPKPRAPTLAPTPTRGLCRSLARIQAWINPSPEPHPEQASSAVS